jgi:hypothetical protein
MVKEAVRSFVLYEGQMESIEDAEVRRYVCAPAGSRSRDPHDDLLKLQPSNHPRMEQQILDYAVASRMPTLQRSQQFADLHHTSKLKTEVE